MPAPELPSGWLETLSDVLFSVVIPTFNRIAELTRTLNALARQDLAPEEFEVIIVDDGSTDQTASTVRRLQSDYPTKLHYYYQPNRKQGAARNLGAHSAEGEFLIFLGDDITPATDFLTRHSQARHQFSADTDVIIGYTTWPEGFKVTRFLEYIGEQGWQFGFSLIQDPADVPFNFFYTSNISISRRFFFDSGGFDEGFREYGWEDIELSLRMKALGMRLRFWPEARAFHYHPTRLNDFIKRQHQVGVSAWKFYLKHPQLANFLGTKQIPDYRITDHLKMFLLTQACRLTEGYIWPDLSRFYPDLMSYYYIQGLIEGRESPTLSE